MIGMAEYIERKRLLRRFNIDDMMNVNGTLISLEDARNTISNFPTADVAPVVHGKWIIPTKIGHRSFNIPHCSVCNGIPCGVDENTNYCPNCGAKMDGNDNDD